MDPIIALAGPILDIAKIPLSWIGAEMGRADNKTNFNYSLIADASNKEGILYQMAMQERQAQAKKEMQNVIIIVVIAVGMLFLMSKLGNK